MENFMQVTMSAYQEAMKEASKIFKKTKKNKKQRK